MSNVEVFIPIVFFLTIGAIWGSFILTRHRERITMLDKGLTPEDIKHLYQRDIARVNTISSLKWGIVGVAIGLAVMTGMWIRQSTMVGEGIYPALVALFGGTGLIVFYAIARKRPVAEL